VPGECDKVVVDMLNLLDLHVGMGEVQGTKRCPAGLVALHPSEHGATPHEGEVVRSSQ
jgi:hypothetical protein